MENERKITIPQLLIVLMVVLAIMFYETFIFMTIYNWFIPLATGWSKISYWLAFGIVILIDFLRSHNKKNEDKSFTEYIVAILIEISFSSLLLGFAALVHLGV